MATATAVARGSGRDAMGGDTTARRDSNDGTARRGAARARGTAAAAARLEAAMERARGDGMATATARQWRRGRRHVAAGDDGDGARRLGARGGDARRLGARGGDARVLHKPEPKGRGRGGKVQASLLAPRKLDLGKGKEETKGKEVKKKYVAPQEFQLGMPLVGDDVLATLGTACKDLHLYYMEKSNARKPSKATDILGQHNGKPFLGPTNYIVVDFKDLFDLYRLRAVDTSLLKCYSLLSWQWCQKHAPEVAFLDPQVVTVTNLQNDCQGMVNYIYDTLWSRRDKEYIIIDKNPSRWTPIQLAIDKAWAQYVQRGGLRKTGHDTLIHKKDFPVKQQIGDQREFHVCHNMRLLYREKVKTLAEFEGTITKSLTTSFEEAMMNTYYATVMM
uniref:Uncharacterized protein n=1 Tax=Oryza sativa subsp. japonica TaxID=39947 RepID=Q10FS6_ORYSJ|nr:hypothetical protein LOC_Os03g45480 [Oryza sativa Japonica Group]